MDNSSEKVIEEIVEHDKPLENLDPDQHNPMPLPEISDEEMAEILEYLDKQDGGSVETEVLVDPVPASGDKLDIDIKSDLDSGRKLSTIAQPVPRELSFKFPYVTCGKLFSESPDGNRWVSSAVLIRRDVVLTCAHCVHDGPTGGLHKNVTFSILHPYPDPYRTRAKSIYLHEGWASVVVN